jgi:hypothetical protein
MKDGFVFCGPLAVSVTWDLFHSYINIMLYILVCMLVGIVHSRTQTTEFFSLNVSLRHIQNKGSRRDQIL